MRRVNRTDQQVSRWKNGGGLTRVLATEPVGADFDAFDWRLSMATIEQDGPFSVFPGVDRTLVLMSGRDLELVVDGTPHRLSAPGAILRFPGEADVAGRLCGGVTEDLNLMVRRGRCRAEVAVVGDGVVSGIVVGLDAESTVNGEVLGYGDAVQGDGLRVRGRVVHVQVAGASRATVSAGHRAVSAGVAVLPALYESLVPWYSLLDPREDHEEDAAVFARAVATVGVTGGTLLELGAGAGNTAHFLRSRFQCTLTDLSPAMLALSEEANPDCDHLVGDMRTLRLGRTFDAVLVHDAICYMLTEADLRQMAETAFAHIRPGGAAVFVPDAIADSFAERSHLHEGEADGRSLRCLEWTWDADPADTTYTVDYAFLLRDASGVRAVHDRHVEGLFSEAVWHRVLREAGFVVQTFVRDLDEEEAGYSDRYFLGHRLA